MLQDTEKKNTDSKEIDEDKEEKNTTEEPGEPKEDNEPTEGDEAKSDAPPSATELSKKRKKQILIAAIGALVIVIIAAIGAYFYIESKNKAAAAQLSGEQAAKKIFFRELDEIIVNLNTENKSTSFMKLKITLELEGEDNLSAVNNMIPRVNDILQVYLRELRPQDMQGSLGLYRLREEVLLRINKVLYPAKINDILFDQVLIQ